MDSYNHYLIAKYGWKHPELLLDYWGKPIYNIIALPFSQFGLDGVVILNILCLIGSAFLVYLTAKQLEWKRPLLVFFISLLSPIFLDNSISSLTEPLNALMLSWLVLMASRSKWASVAILAGFLPFARSEGFVILAVVGLFFLYRKSWKSIALLAIGPLVFNLLGWLIEGQMFWVITENPYLKFELSGENVCGNGTFYHYFRWGHITFGLLIAALLGYSLIPWIKNRQSQPPAIHLIYFIFIAYFSVHALIWWQGMMGSCGYIRVMVVIAPLAALMATYGINDLLERIPKPWHLILLTLFGLNLLYTPYRYYHYKYPLKVSQEQALYLEVNAWLEQEGYSSRTMAYMYPYLSVVNDRDPWDRAVHEELWKTSLPYYQKHSLILWDAHFGANEAQIPLQLLMEDPNYKLLKSFIPEVPFKTLNDYDFEIYVFEKLTDAEG